MSSRSAGPGRATRRPRLAAFAIAAVTAAGLFGGLAVPASAATPAPAAAAAPAAAPKTPVELGIHDSAINQCISVENKAKHGPGWSTRQNITLAPGARAAAISSFKNKNWISVKTVRFIAPWDIADHLDQNAADNHKLAVKEACMDVWLKRVKKAGAQPEIDLGPDLNYKPGGRIEAPAITTYAAAVKEFTNVFSNASTKKLNGRARVRIIAAWNEPDLLAKPSRRVYTPQGGAMATPGCKSDANTCGPVLAARMWQTVRADCKTCTVIAGDFSSNGGIRGKEKGYLTDYRRALGNSRPKVWALHPYTDVEKFESKWHKNKNNKCVENKGQPNLSKSLVAQFANDLKNSSATQIWLNEISAFQYHTQSGKSRPCWTPVVQAAAARYLLNTLPKAAKSGDPAVTRVDYFNFQSTNKTNNRWSIVLDNGKVQPVRSALKNG